MRRGLVELHLDGAGFSHDHEVVPRRTVHHPPSAYPGTVNDRSST
jgi:hypothetical protein